MKRCPHCGESLLSPKERLPAKLTGLQKDYIAFCSRSRTTAEMRVHFNTSMSAVYRMVRLLQSLEQIEKLQESNPSGYNHGCTFKATGKPLALDPDYMQYTDKPIVMGVRL
jgi:hypothetical protein